MMQEIILMWGDDSFQYFSWLMVEATTNLHLCIFPTSTKMRLRNWWEKSWFQLALSLVTDCPYRCSLWHRVRAGVTVLHTQVHSLWLG